ncbi:hypothetical protein SAMN04488529_11756 [Clostridium gasigenes]|uniref:Uncharacterized protein n=1 Tax=Clostridium gasigenes TaxID=94869 RepID=A0A1H0VKV6_9CLOT|nr:hypothetical protein SAMN04488529_11756 [Clostridium gasigenes]
MCIKILKKSDVDKSENSNISNLFKSGGSMLKNSIK